MAAANISSDFGARENKVCHCLHCFSTYWSPSPGVMGLGFMIFIYWMLSLKPAFSVSSFTFIKRFFSSSSLYVLRVVSSAYLRLLIFLPAILIPVSASSSCAFSLNTKYSAFKLNKQCENIQPWCTPFEMWNQSVPCPALTVASWPAS